MKLNIVTKNTPINILGQLDPVELCPTNKRVVFIDDKLVPTTLAQIILLGLDTAMEKHCDQIEELMKLEGHKIR